MTDEEKQAEQQELAQLQFTRAEIETITGLDIHEPSFQKGTLIAQAEVRRSILQMAKQGSSPAQKQFLELITKNKRTKAEVKTITEWAKVDPDDFKIGVLSTLAWLFTGGKSPKEEDAEFHGK